MKKTIALISVLAGMASVFTGCSVDIKMDPEEVSQVLSNPVVSELEDKAAEQISLNVSADSASGNKSEDKNSSDKDLSDGNSSSSVNENISSDEKNETPESEITSEDENVPDDKNSHIVYPEGEPGYDGIDVDDMLCGTVGDDGEYYVINFLRNKDFQAQINADIREISDELYKYAGDYSYASDEGWNPSGTYSFNTRGLLMWARCENGFLGLSFGYEGGQDSDGYYKFDHVRSLSYDIIKEKKIESFDELFTMNCYEELNDVFRDNLSYSGRPFSEEVTPSNITDFTPWVVRISDTVVYSTDMVSLKNADGTFSYDIGKFYIPAYRRDMTDYIDPAYSMFHNQFYGK